MGAFQLIQDFESPEPIGIGQRAPDFALTDEKGNEWRLSEQLGQVTAILFYPKNETLVCTKQLCSLRDNWVKYSETKASVIGISPGTVEDHRAFAQKYKLPLPILVDSESKITKIFSQHWLFPISLTRGIVVIDAKGIVRTKKIMLRLFRPTDRCVITAIHAARADLLGENYDSILREHKSRVR